MISDCEKMILQAAKIKRLIKEKQMTYRDLGHPTEVSLVVNGVRKTDKVRRKIARKLGVKKSTLWPRSQSFLRSTQ